MLEHFFYILYLRTYSVLAVLFFICIPDWGSQGAEWSALAPRGPRATAEVQPSSQILRRKPVSPSIKSRGSQPTYNYPHITDLNFCLRQQSMNYCYKQSIVSVSKWYFCSQSSPPWVYIFILTLLLWLKMDTKILFQIHLPLNVIASFRNSQKSFEANSDNECSLTRGHHWLTLNIMFLD